MHCSLGFKDYCDRLWAYYRDRPGLYLIIHFLSSGWPGIDLSSTGQLGNLAVFKQKIFTFVREVVHKVNKVAQCSKSNNLNLRYLLLVLNQTITPQIHVSQSQPPSRVA